MPITICWVEQTDKSENSFTVETDAGKLIVYQINNIISRTTWESAALQDKLIVDKLKNTQIQQYINNPEENNLTINLQKQGTIFRNKVWAEICKIPAGKVLSYSDIAVKIGSGARAVANACRDNPFPGIIPCHRVVSISGLGGYMGKTSGEFFEIKKKLLAIEKII